MGLFDKSSTHPPTILKESMSTDPRLDLGADDIELILKLLATCNFPVKDIERLYAVIVKLQQEYSRLKTK